MHVWCNMTICHYVFTHKSLMWKIKFNNIIHIEVYNGCEKVVVYRCTSSCVLLI